MERELVAKHGVSFADAIEALNDAKCILDGKMSTLWGKPELMMMASQLLGTATQDEKDSFDDDWNPGNDNCFKMDRTMGETTSSWDAAGGRSQQQVFVNAVSQDETSADVGEEEAEAVTLQIIMNDNDILLTQKRHVLPEELKCAGVPLGRWQTIYDGIDKELAPALNKLNKCLLSSLDGKKEQQQLLSLKLNVMTSNVTLLACNIVQKANFLFNPYGIMVQQITQQQPIPGAKESTAIQLDQPIGLKFVVFGEHPPNENMLSGRGNVPQEILLYPCH